jgi:hypothetical protein
MRQTLPTPLIDRSIQTSEPVKNRLEHGIAVLKIFDLLSGPRNEAEVGYQALPLRP